MGQSRQDVAKRYFIAPSRVVPGGGLPLPSVPRRGHLITEQPQREQLVNTHSAHNNSEAEHAIINGHFRGGTATATPL